MIIHLQKYSLHLLIIFCFCVYAQQQIVSKPNSSIWSAAEEDVVELAKELREIIHPYAMEFVTKEIAVSQIYFVKNHWQASLIDIDLNTPPPRL